MSILRSFGNLKKDYFSVSGSAGVAIHSPVERESAAETAGE